MQGLRPSDRVVIIEDEVTTGRTVISAVRAMRRAGVQITDVGAVLVVDDPAMWKRMADDKITLHAGIKLQCDYGARILGSSPPPCG